MFNQTSYTCKLDTAWETIQRHCWTYVFVVTGGRWRQNIHPKLLDRAYLLYTRLISIHSNRRSVPWAGRRAIGLKGTVRPLGLVWSEGGLYTCGGSQFFSVSGSVDATISIWQTQGRAEGTRKMTQMKDKPLAVSTLHYRLMLLWR